MDNMTEVQIMYFKQQKKNIEMKAKIIKDLLNKIPDDSEVLFEYSCFIFGGHYDKQPSIINKSELKDYEEDFGEDITDSCDFLISFD